MAAWPPGENNIQSGGADMWLSVDVIGRGPSLQI